MEIEYALKNYPQIWGPAEGHRGLVVFLAGVTPIYSGNDRARWSWRDKVAVRLDQMLAESHGVLPRIILACPEPEDRNWSSVSGDELHWEHQWLERADIIVFWHETRWKPNRQTNENCYMGMNGRIANIGVQFRFEVGMYIGRKDKVRIFYLPPHADGTGGARWWIRHKADQRLRWTDDEDALVAAIFQELTK
ncbi:MAG: hypothetical protein ACYCOU_04725 [Sulfobacillus sp.]